ncbi:MAG: hypothetical protein JXJ17_16275 [Anaerolineae bacterium]|nr:hypothetical protein [Anaerolineae bacterium]
MRITIQIEETWTDEELADLLRPGPSLTGSEIVVSGVRLDDQTMRLSVSDNGAGFTPARLAKIRAEISDYSQALRFKDSGFGLDNVNKRVRLYYGEEHKLEIESVHGEHTSVSLVIPILGKNNNGRAVVSP